jgi:hypothetical protein
MNGCQLGVNGYFLLADCLLADELEQNWVKLGMFAGMARDHAAPFVLHLAHE